MIPDGNNHRVLKVVRSLACIKQIEVCVICDPQRNVVFSGLCTTFILPEIDFYKESHLKKIREIIIKKNIKILLPISELGIRYTIQNREEIENFTKIAPIPDLKAFDTANNKWLFYQFAVKNKIDTPKSVNLKEFLSDQTILDDFNFPILLKPYFGEGGQGIEVFDEKDILNKRLKEIPNESKFSNYMIQEYIDGFDIDFSAICENGKIIAYTIQKPLIKHGNDNFSFGKIIEFVENNEVYEISKRMFSELNWTGVIHADFVINEKAKRISILDLNPRFWGSLYGSVSAGVNFPYLSVLRALNQSFPRQTFCKIIFSELTTWEKLKILFGIKPMEQMSLKNSDLRYVMSDLQLPVRQLLKLENSEK